MIDLNKKTLKNWIIKYDYYTDVLRFYDDSIMKMSDENFSEKRIDQYAIVRIDKFTKKPLSLDVHNTYNVLHIDPNVIDKSMIIESIINYFNER